MPVYVTYFDAKKHSERLGGFAGAPDAQGMYSSQLSAEEIAVGGHGTPHPSLGRYAEITTTENCRIDVVGGSESANANSGVWVAGKGGDRFVAAGQRISTFAL